MTREEAIKELKELEYYNRPFDNSTEATDIATRKMQAVAMAIKALEQEPCEDAISRQAVHEQINCWIGSGEYRYTNATDYLNKRIKALQAVNLQEKVGYWMPIEYPTGVEAFGVKEMSAQELQCSECGKTVDISDGDFKYCPYCKAKMIEPQESEE